MPNEFDQQIIEEFRANGGRVGGMFEGGRLLLLTTTGARSGKPHTTPLGYLPDEGGRVLVIASAGGSPKHPAWYHNLVANPRATVETGPFAYQAAATVLSGDERDRVFARAAEADPGWAEYEERSGRVLPVVALAAADPGPPEYPGGMGDTLKAIHEVFRRELAIVRAEVAASGPGITAQLRVNCLAFCQGLGHHHTMEGQGMFPHLEREHPELAEPLNRLYAEHETVERLLTELQATIKDGDPASLLGEIDRLIAELEAHLDYEEEQLVPVLNALPGRRAPGPR
ncbi:nitroreductase/quinone reductase family protein [Spirillospora albida]|uniref:nitroreductase/quinone reductase family protein n=1 Tax=Spirillospora albida TaxID=58123 RepID=UPI0004C19E25|nr:nitroreductase/quinone reductase family protein [Spirillospora albida]